MTFGQATGPSAPQKLLAQLLGLLEQAGYASFREARHPYGLSQRQANGKFTTAEATALIERLSSATEVGTEGVTEGGVEVAAEQRPVAADSVAMAFPDELLAEELVRRGWTCIPPG